MNKYQLPCESVPDGYYFLFSNGIWTIALVESNKLYCIGFEGFSYLSDAKGGHLEGPIKYKETFEESLEAERSE